MAASRGEGGVNVSHWERFQLATTFLLIVALGVSGAVLSRTE